MMFDRRLAEACFLPHNFLDLPDDDTNDGLKQVTGRNLTEELKTSPDRSAVVEDIPVMALGTEAAPGQSVPLRLFEPRYRAMVRRMVEKSGGLFVLVGEELDASGHLLEDGIVGMVCKADRVGFISDDLQSAITSRAIARVLLTGRSSLEEEAKQFGLSTCSGVVFLDTEEPDVSKILEEDYIRQAIGEERMEVLKGKDVTPENLRDFFERVSLKVSNGMTRSRLWKSRSIEARLRAVLAGDPSMLETTYISCEANGSMKRRVPWPLS